VLPSLKIELPLVLTGCSRFDQAAVTVTVKDSVPMLPAASLAVQTTVVLPRAKVLPEGLPQLAATAPSTMSVAIGAV
jgi:hypothetical protein